jgi:hypothetical protein
VTGADGDCGDAARWVESVIASFRIVGERVEVVEMKRP